MELFSKMELIIMTAVLGSVLLIILFLTILDFIDEKKAKKKNIVLEKKEEIKPVMIEVENHEPKEMIEEIEVLDFDEPIIEMKEELANNVVIEQNKKIVEEVKEVNFSNEEIKVLEEDKKEDIGIQEFGFEEIVPNKVNENIIVVENNQETAKEELAKIERELQKEESYEDTITNFELEQEEMAIISYDELIKVSDKLYTQNEIVQYDDGNEPITIDEVIKRFANNDMSFENTANLDKLNRELDKDKNLVNVYESK